MWLVHDHHIARALGAYSQTPAAGPSSPAPELRPRVPAPTPPLMVETKAASRWRDIVGWLSILAGAAVRRLRWRCRWMMPALTVSVMLALWLRGLRTVYMPVPRGV